MNEKPTVLIYRDHLLQTNEHFIYRMAEALENFTPWYIGIKRVDGLLLPPERALTVNRGGLAGLVDEVAFKYFRPSPDFVRRVQSLRPSLIHAQFGPDGVRALPLTNLLHLPLIVHYRGFDATLDDQHLRQLSRRTRIYVQRREDLKKEAALFIAVSEFIRRKLIDQGFPPEKVVVHYTGVDCDFFTPDPAVKREPVALFVGRLVEKKGCAYAIQAMEIVQSAWPEARLVIIGDGPLRDPLKKMASARLRSYDFLGALPLHEVRGWMNRARVLILPSITTSSGEAEGLPNVAVEGQAMGLPVVGFAHAGIPEAVISDRSGFLVPEGDTGGLGRMACCLFEDDALRASFSAEGQRQVRSNFNLKERTLHLQKYYQAVRTDLD